MQYQDVANAIADWLRSVVSLAKVDGVVTGVSGGIDAAVCAGLCARALGAERTTAVLIQTTGNQDEHRSGLQICSCFGLEPVILDYRAAYNVLITSSPPADDMTLGNFRDRMRSAALYYIANMQNRLVVSTINKNEYLLGYFCKNGSGTSDIMPVADLYKSDVWNLGRYLGVPQEIVDKEPTGDYWPGQIDEDVIGVPYREQEPMLRLIERGQSPEQETDAYKRLRAMVERTAHKRSLPLRCVLKDV
jgi:NAD+ synthase